METAINNTQKIVEIKTKYTLSVIIPSYKSKYLSKVIQSAKEFDPLEIIVVDTSPNMPILEGVSLYHQTKRLNAAEARNKGAEMANGDLLLFIDSDVVLNRKNLKLINDQLFKEDNNVICGLYEKYPEENYISRFQRGIIERRLVGNKSYNPKISSSSHFLIRKNDFKKSGGFNETMEFYEDVEFFLRCRVIGLNIILDKQFLAIHLKEFKLSTLINDYWCKTIAAIDIRFKIPKLFKGNNGGDIPISMHFSGGIGIITIFSFVIYLIGIFIGIGYAYPFLNTSLFLILLLITVFSFPSSGLKVPRIKGVILWTICYGTIWSGLIYSITKITIKKFINIMIELSDFARSGKRVLLRNGRPIQIINYVTSRCNLRCSHCFYKDSLNNPNPGEIPRQNLIKTMKEIGPVLWYSLAGGEPFIRSDLENIIQDVQNYCRPKVFSFPTNGWYTEKTFKTVLRTLQRLKRGNIILFFSLDGPEHIHDEIRGKGSFKKLSQTIKRLRDLKKIYNNLYINFILTVTPNNAEEAPQFIRQIARNFKADTISINLIREHKPNAPMPPAYVINAYEETINAYAEEVSKGKIGGYKFVGSKFLRAKEFIQKQSILKVARDNQFVTPCTAGTLSYVIMEDGSVKPCEILFDKIGDVYDKDKSFFDIVRSKKTKKLREWIRDSECKCTYECAMSTNTLFSLNMIPKLIYKTFIPD